MPHSCMEAWLHFPFSSACRQFVTGCWGQLGDQAPIPSRASHCCCWHSLSRGRTFQPAAARYRSLRHRRRHAALKYRQHCAAVSRDRHSQQHIWHSCFRHPFGKCCCYLRSRHLTCSLPCCSWGRHSWRQQCTTPDGQCTDHLCIKFRSYRNERSNRCHVRSGCIRHHSA